MSDLEIVGIKELRAKLGKIAAGKHLADSMQRAVYILQADLAKYPQPMPPGHWAKTTTAAQKRAFFAQLKNGGWKGRRGTQGRRWTTSVRRDAYHGIVVGKVGNNTKYGPWVQSDRFQARMHKNRWQTDQQVLERNRAEIVRMFNDGIRRALAG